MTININECSIELEGLGRRAYLNSLSGRRDLLADCGLYDAMDIYKKIMAVWGEAPTVPDEPLPPEPTFDELKAAKIDELTASFSVRTRGAITTTSGYTMQFDTTDSLKMQGAISLMESIGQAEGYLTQADDTTVYNVPLDTMKAVLIEMMSAYAACHGRKQELRALINSAQTAEELDEIVISWPV